MIHTFYLLCDPRLENLTSQHNPHPSTHLNWLCTKSLDTLILCATSVFSVSLWLMNSEQKHTTETQRTQRLHREEGLHDFLCKAISNQFDPGTCLNRSKLMSHNSPATATSELLLFSWTREPDRARQNL